jgi:hypothetical protein
MSIMSDFLSGVNPKNSAQPTLRRVPQTRQQFRDAHPISALDALRRNALAFESYQRDQKLHSRPRTYKPVRSGHAVEGRRAA